MYIQLLVLSAICVNSVEVSGDGGSNSGCPLCPPSSSGRCEFLDTARDECFYTVDGEKVRLQAAGGYYLLRCGGEGLRLGGNDLPRLPALRGAPRTVIEHCGPPGEPYEVALRTMNVSVLDELVLAMLPTQPSLQGHHLQGMSYLKRLEISATTGSKLSPLPPDLLSPLSSLTHLQISSIPLSTAALLTLPSSLESLILSRCSLSQFSPGALSRLSRLRRLMIDDLVLVSPPYLPFLPSLSSVLISAPLPEPPPLHTLINATLSGVLKLQLLTGCGSLQRLYVMGAPITELRGRFLQGENGEQCSELVELRLSSLPSLSHVAETALEGGSALQTLSLSGCRSLTSLPANLLLGARRLRSLNLSRNQLRTLPDELLSPLTSLESLDLSANALGPTIAPPLGALGGLKILKLGGNPLGDLCSAQDDLRYGHVVTSRSALSPLTSLRALSLSNTGQVRVCADWRQQLTSLTSLELQDNNITQLGGRDFIWGWAGEGEVDLRGNPIEGIVLSHGEYEELIRERGRRDLHTVRMRLEGAMSCGCGQYWVARALREGVLRGVEGARCRERGRDVELARADLTLMKCEVNEECATNCSCQWRPHDDTLLAECRGVNAVPVFPPERTLNVSRLELRVCCGIKGELNGLGGVVAPSTRGLEEFAFLPGAVRVIDLSANALSLAAPLLGQSATNITVRLANNPLLCDCEEIAAMHLHRNVILDFVNVTCSDGKLVSSFNLERHCRPMGGMIGTLLGVVGLLIASGTVMGSRAIRGRVKRALWRRRRKVVKEDNYIYDGFLVFSHHDSEVSQRVLDELESARGLRLCVHWRDWVPGEWLPTAVARSVRTSRRTVAIVSEHFPQAVWARAELRQALGRHALGRGKRPVMLLAQPLMPASLKSHARDCRVLTAQDAGVWDTLYSLLANEGTVKKQPTPQQDPQPLQSVPMEMEMESVPEPTREPSTAPCA